MPIKLIIGLRNPGASYAQTRHNAGEWFVQALAQAYHANFTLEKKLQAESTSITVDDHPCKMLLPLSFMNQSGLSLQNALKFSSIEPQDVLVVHDDLDLDVGRIKIKSGGGHGGHNGLRDIIARLGTNHFHRLRIGIGHPGHKDQVVDYVLHKPKPTERQLILEAIDRGLTIIPFLLKGEIETAMNRLN